MRFLLFVPRHLSITPSTTCRTLSGSVESAPRDGYIGKGVSGARERDISAFPMADSFDSFLAETRKEYNQAPSNEGACLSFADRLILFTQVGEHEISYPLSDLHSGLALQFLRRDHLQQMEFDLGKRLELL